VDLYNRIIIPSYDLNGDLNYFIARWYPKEYNKLKYINPKAEKQEIIFNIGKLNLDATIYLVEGVTDHIVTPNSIPLLRYRFIY
jgi:DNA primase